MKVDGVGTLCYHNSTDPLEKSRREKGVHGNVMKIGEVRDYVRALYLAGPGIHTLYFEGEVGIGKSTAVREAAQDCAKGLDKAFVDFAKISFDLERVNEIYHNPDRFFLFHDYRLTTLEPSDLSGIPKEVSLETLSAIRHSPLLWALCFSKCAGILFLDELPNIQRPDVQSASLQLLLDLRAGDIYFSDEVMVLSAGNASVHSSLANMLSAAQLERITKIQTIPPSPREWAVWMDRTHPDDWDRRALGYLEQFPEEIVRQNVEAETDEPFPAPRGWTKVTRVLHKLQNPRHQEATIVGKLGRETGTRFVAFLNTDIPDIETLIARPEAFAKLSGRDLDAQYLVATLLGMWLRKQVLKESKRPSAKAVRNVERAIGLLSAMADHSAEFVVLTILSIAGEDERIAVTKCLLKKDKRIAQFLEEMSDMKTFD